MIFINVKDHAESSALSHKFTGLLTDDETQI